MKLSEAIKALEDGKKVRYKGWDSNLFLILIGGVIRCENMEVCSLRTSNLPMDYWELYEEPKPKEKYKTVKAWFCTSMSGDGSIYVSEKTIGPNQSKLSLGVGSMPFIQEIQIPESQPWEFEE